MRISHKSLMPSDLEATACSHAVKEALMKGRMIRQRGRRALPQRASYLLVLRSNRSDEFGAMTFDADRVSTLCCTANDMLRRASFDFAL